MCPRLTKILVLFCALFPGFLLGQSDSDNLDKYWQYRSILKEKFVHLGTERGDGIPAEKIDPNFYVKPKKGLWLQSDGTSYLGFYLAVLATEYKLRKNAGLATDSLVQEIYYALNALWRLDAQSNYYSYSNDWGKFPKENGASCSCKFSSCYICDNCPNNPAISLRAGAPRDSMNSSNYNDKDILDGFFIRSDAPCGYDNHFEGIELVSSDMLSPFSNKGTNKEMSQDQVIFLMLGLYGISQSLEGTVEFNGVPLGEFARQEGERIVEQLKGGCLGSWYIKNPNTRKKVTRGAWGFGYGYPKAQLGNVLSKGAQSYGNFFSATNWLLWSIQRYPGLSKPLSNGEMNLAMDGALAAVGNSWKGSKNGTGTSRGLAKYAKPKYFRELYFLYFKVFHGTQKSYPQTSQARYRGMLNFAPKDGIKSPWPECNAKNFGWNSNNRFTGSRFDKVMLKPGELKGNCNIPGQQSECVMPTIKKEEQKVTVDSYCFGEPGSSGQLYNGLDYMLLHNLYRLAFADSLEGNYHP